MIIFPCHVCQTALQAEDAQAGHLVRCPTCSTTLRVPPPASVAAEMQTVGAGGPASSAAGPDGFGAATEPHRQPNPFGQLSSAASGPRSGGRRYGFNCGYCSSRLEATEAMGAQEGQCPTCGNNITIPILDRYGRLIDPHTRQIIKQDPHPVHAYAAAGERAPAIVRQTDGKQLISCPRCHGSSPISANNCKACGMPFTMEGTTLEAAGSSNGFCVASLVLGIVGLPAFFCFVTPLLAVIFGIVGYSQVTKSGAEGGGKGMAIAGIILGAIGCFFGLMWLSNR
jgi:hypothetical protein